MTLMIENELLILALLLLLSFATISDVVRNIIPNLVSLAILCCGLMFQVSLEGWVGSITALAGLLIGFFIFIPFYLAGGMAAGDVKLMAAIGSLLGPLATMLAAGFSLIAGSFLALVIVLLQGDFLQLLKRYYRIIKTFSLTFQLIYEKPKANESASLRFPYALAISAGTVLALAQQSLLSFYHLKSLLSGGVL